MSLRGKDLVFESLRSGTIASVVMMPIGWLFTALGLRVGHYGKRVLELIVGELDGPMFRVLLMIEHFIIGWLSAVPLLIALVLWAPRIPALLQGLAYGTGYYVVVNSLALPWFFAETTPCQLGWSTIYPSLIVHIVFGLSIAYTAKPFVHRSQLD